MFFNSVDLEWPEQFVSIYRDHKVCIFFIWGIFENLFFMREWYKITLSKKSKYIWKVVQLKEYIESGLLIYWGGLLI